MTIGETGTREYCCMWKHQFPTYLEHPDFLDILMDCGRDDEIHCGGGVKQ